MYADLTLAKAYGGDLLYTGNEKTVQQVPHLPYTNSSPTFPQLFLDKWSIHLLVNKEPCRIKTCQLTNGRTGDPNISFTMKDYIITCTDYRSKVLDFDFSLHIVE